ncbi:hypothetical protein GDO86_010018, partial [Hymenochirus boettgeri]
ELFGYKTVRWRQTLCMIGYFCSLGFLRILFSWKPKMDIWCQCVPCSLGEADIILLRTTDELKQYSKKKVLEQYIYNPSSKSGYQISADKNSIISKSVTMPEGKIRFIKVQKIRYIWNTVDGMFQKIGVLEEELSCSDVHTKFGSGLTTEEQEIRQQVCGSNTIEVKIKPIWILFFKEIFNPFYFFQAYGLCVWMAFSYFEYSTAILAISILSITVIVYNLRMQSIKLHRMAKSYNSIMVTVLDKNRELKEVESQSLVPGDVIVLPEKRLFLPCDAILISGACTINEAMLTGECFPVTKIPLPCTEGTIPWKSGEDYKKHVLFCGTEVIQTKSHGQGLVKAVVFQTGFNTAKGELVRAILYNKPANVKLHKQAIRFIFVNAAIALVGISYTAVIFTINEESVHNTVLMCLLMLSVAMNADLPATLTLGLLCAQSRLKKKGIFCISPQRINVAGQLNLVCFDKTGTLTEDALDLHAVIASDGNRQETLYYTSGKMLSWGPLLGAMASCHSLIVLDGELHGDPLDLKMFEGTGWVLENHKAHGTKDGELVSSTLVKPGPKAGKVPVEGIIILHQFPFSSTLQRMSVIAQVIGEPEYTVFLKGAPEMVVRFCNPKTVPPNISEKLDVYTTKGYRVIGLAYRILQRKQFTHIQQLERNMVETDLIFLGFLILQNHLKAETNCAIQELKEAKIRTVMITGDNLQTALNIGLNCGMIQKNSKIIKLEANEPQQDIPASITWKSQTESQEIGHKDNENCDVNNGLGHNAFLSGDFHFAMSGRSFQIVLQHFYDLMPKILLNGTIFARMTPQQKSILIDEFQKLDYYVGMCGDGANDCGALKVAHVGISLSELEASVASSFTSKITNIKCVPMLIKEGRNALVTCISTFKFLTVFILTGSTALLILLSKKTIFSDSQYLIFDLAICMLFCLTAGLNGPAPKLTPYRPPGQLLSPSFLLSILLHFVFTITLHTTAFLLLQQQPWYNETDVFSACLPLYHSKDNVTMKEPGLSENYLVTTEWIITGMHLIVIELVFAKGSPFRQRLYTNYLLSFIIAMQVGIYLFFLFGHFEFIYSAFEMVCTPYYWRVSILIMVLVLLFVSYSVEEGILENRKLWELIKKISKYQSKSQYKELQRRLQMDSEWPPQNRTDYASQSFSVIDSNIFKK